MKTVLAILLVVTLVVALIPAGMQADAAAVTKKPFYTLNMEPFFWEEGDLVMDMVYFGSHLNTDQTEAIITWNRQTDIAAIAKDLKDEFDARPEGTRYIYMHLPCHVINVKSGLIEDYIFFDKPTAIIKKWTEEFMAEYKRIGGKLDGASVDIEYIHGDAYYICTEQYEKGNKGCYWEIVNNPKYRTDMRPKLERMGFDFWPESKQDSEKSEIWSMSPRVDGFAKNYYIWNNAVGELLTESINESVLEPMLKHYPDALLSDYGRYDYYGWQKPYLGSIATLLGNAVKVGNVSSRQCYPTDPWENAVGLYKTPDGYNNANYIASPFNMVLWRTNDVKGIVEADTNNRISTWITFYNFMPTLPGSYCNTPYYSEQIYHLGMLDPQPFLGYVIESEVGQYGLDHPDPDASDPEVVRGVIGELMAELTRVAGYSDRKPIRIPANWNNDYILSGMYANGRNIFRITPDTTSGMTLDAFKVEGDDPTFSINGQTVTFPQGKIITDSKISKVGTCGYWVETPANVMPVMTSDADRYEKDPSFVETFEDFANGAAFTENVTDAWKVSGKTANVMNKGGSKALAFSGNTRLTNVNAPKNITAGDKYAQQQVWQVTVTVPKGGELQLLSASNKDLGVKIADGKVYYDNGGSYGEIPGVSVTAGSTYTIKREVNFTNATSDYAVYDASGKSLGSVKGKK
ncbi:MAG: hypothetical protein IKK11_05465, partial [Oscillospiraceae bacterium]|nr:hypothetical protein [Oscillospiraceae bacterium]